MISRIEVGFKEGIRDAPGELVCRRINEDMGLPVTRVATRAVYTVEADLTPAEMRALAEGPLSDPVIETFSIGSPIPATFDWLVEVGFKPGVTDNVGRTAREAIEYRFGRTLGPAEGVYTSTQYLIHGRLSREQVESIATGLLGNQLIERFTVMDFETWSGSGGVPVEVPRVSSAHSPQVREVPLEVPDEELERISREGILALSLKEMKEIQAYARSGEVREARAAVGLGVDLTDVELEALAQTWSEHCKHKIFNARIRYTEEQGETREIDSLFDTYIRHSTEEIRARLGPRDWCVSVFKDNAGVIRFNDDWNLVFKVETHNSPSALDPYGGALTGIVGVNRDPFGTGIGARLIFNVDTFCFAPPDYDKPMPPRLLHPKRIFEGVRLGVEHGGNKSGIPTVNGSLVFDDRYAGKPLVYCGTGGIMPREINGRPSELKRAEPGDIVVMAGGRIGKDGIHGATFSSEELHKGSPVSAVQIGDPITQKRMTDFLLRARDAGLYRAITDNGAGGLSSSVGEMARDPNGCEIDIDKAPLKYAGLDPWETLLSEAQERMTLAVPPEKLEAFVEMAGRMKVEATPLGRFTDSGYFHVRFEGRTAAYLDMDFLHEGVPRMELEANWKPPRFEEPDLPCPDDLAPALRRMLGRLNICSKEYVIRQYDHEVQGGSVVKPLVGADEDGPGDAAVLRPLLDTLEGVVVSSGICPRYSDIDTYAMMSCAIDEAMRNYLSVGGALGPMAGLDNFCWCDPVRSAKTPDGAYKLAQLVRANMALYDTTTAYGVPCISGKDSMKNDYMIGETKISIPPTVLFSMVGRIEDVRLAVTMDAKRPGDLVYVLGLTRPELGASEYYALHGFIGNVVPRVVPGRNLALYRALHGAIRRRLVDSCHDCSDGGLGVALAETAFAGGFGMEVDLAGIPAEAVERDDHILFSESQGRFVVTVSPEQREAFEEAMEGNFCAQVGQVVEGETFRVKGLSGAVVIEAGIRELKEAWQAPLRW